MKQFTQGMNKDATPAFQPQGTYRDALNVNLSILKGSITNEEGVTIISALDNFEVLGSITLDDDSIVIFGRDRIDATPDSAFFNTIALLYPKKDRVTILYSHPDLNFKSTHPVTGVFRKNQAGETIVYFTDGYYKEEDTNNPSSPTYVSEYNPPRVLNVTRQLNWVETPGNFNVLYGDGTKSPKNLELSPRIGKHAYFLSGEFIGPGVKIQEGGALECGAYYLALAYTDDDGLETNYFAVSNPVYIAAGRETAVPSTSITGGPEGTKTNKSISWYVSVPPDALYSFIQPSLIKVSGETTTATKLSPVKMPTGSANWITATGIDEAGSISIEDITVDDVSYLTAQTIEQVNNRLYLGNLRTNKDIGYQPFANHIKLSTQTESVTAFNPRVYDVTILNQGYSQMIMTWNSRIGQTFKRDLNYNSLSLAETNFSDTDINKARVIEGYYYILSQLGQASGTNDTNRGYKSYRYSYKKKGYRRGEVYAFYISFVLNDGTESYAYHIPGRASMPLGFSIQENDPLQESGTTYFNHRQAYGMFSREFHEYDESLKVYQIADTTDHTRDPSGNGVLVESTTGYWENQNETYPFTPEFETPLKVNTRPGQEGEVIEVENIDSLAGQKVRHHKMPTNQCNNVKGYITNSDVLLNYVSEQGGINGNAIGGQTNQNIDPEGQLVTNETINILGVKLENITIPKYILDNIQGYKIYYAKRTSEDKLIQGQSIAIPAHPRYASVPSQSVTQAKKGPYYKGWYLYGSLVSDDRSAMKIFPHWRYRETNTNGESDGKKKIYYGNPVFTFHDFSMLRKKPDIKGITHVQCQYGVIFRKYLGGPGSFVPLCDYTKLRGARQGNSDSSSGFSDATRTEQESTTLPSSGWVSPEMANTVSYVQGEGQTSSARVVDISDTVTDTNFTVDDTTSLGRIQGQINDDDSAQGPENEDFREAKKRRVRAFFTGMFVGTAYVNPYEVVTTNHFIKGGDNKWGISAGNYNVNTFHDAADYGESSFNEKKHTNQFNFVVAPGSASYIAGRSITQNQDASAFLGASYIYNNGGESSLLIGLVSGLPHLRGHLPKFEQTNYQGANALLFGFTRWGESQFYCFPDAADGSHPLGGITLAYEKAGNNGSEGPHEFENFRGTNFSLSAESHTYVGMPMAWLVNLCSTKADVYNPFDKQSLVWTGYFKRIDVQQELADGGQDAVNAFYRGVESDVIFGGDTYINKYTFRTTSQSYGHCHFRANKNDRQGQPWASDADLEPYGRRAFWNTLNSSGARRDQGDIPSNLDPYSPNMGTTLEDVIWNINSSFYSDIELDTESAADRLSARSRAINASLMENDNWVQGTPDPVSSVFTFMVESEDNIELRHKDTSNDGTMYCDVDPVKKVMFTTPINDLTKSSNLLYASHYSALQDKKVAIPLPKGSRLTDVDIFENRVARSNVDGGSLADGYRKFKALEYKDIDSNRGEIKSMFNLNGTLYLHTRRGIFLTKGKEELQLSAVTAFIGSGNIFAQDADELNQTSTGFGGTDSRHAHVTTEFGHFFINRKDRAVYSMAGNQIDNLSNYGMSTWFRDNMEFKVSEYGIDLESTEIEDIGFNFDAPTAGYGIGFTIGYDPIYKRILVTKREPIPTQEFIDRYNDGEIIIVNNIPTLIPGSTGACVDVVDPADPASARGKMVVPLKTSGVSFCGPISLSNPTYFTEGGWTLSFYPEMKVWGSRHSYRPNLYLHTSDTMLSVAKGPRDSDGNRKTSIWKHGNDVLPGGFYGEIYPSEFEFIDNTAPQEPKLFFNFYYWSDSLKRDINTLSEFDRRTSPGFTSFYAYNSTQITGTGTAIQYLTNARLVDRYWQINDLRDLSKTVTVTQGELITEEVNTSGYITNSVEISTEDEPMFIEEGVVNSDYLDTKKEWYNRRKFVDHYIGIRLINDNSEGNLVHLHGAGTKFRKSYR